MTPAPARCAILASGRSSRMGSPKYGLVIDGATFLERAVAAAGARPCAIVVPPEDADRARGIAPQAAIVANGAAERGMSHALRLALGALDDNGVLPLVVLLVDTPLVDAELVDTMLAALGDADVAYPVRAAQPGHPVVFGPRALAKLGALGDGDTLRLLRDDASLRHVTVPFPDDRPFLDVDTPEEFAAFVRSRSDCDGSG